MLKRLTNPMKRLVLSRCYATRENTSTMPGQDYTKDDKQTLDHLKDDFEDIAVQYQKIVAEKDGMAPSLAEFREMHKIPRTITLFAGRAATRKLSVEEARQGFTILFIIPAIACILLVWWYLVCLYLWKTIEYIGKPF